MSRWYLRADVGRVVVRHPGGRRLWPKIALYAGGLPEAIAWILRRRTQLPKPRRYHWIERIGASAYRSPAKNPPPKGVA